jgi:3-(3-hydroxy-phenyl)propionate hydroxylase
MPDDSSAAVWRRIGPSPAPARDAERSVSVLIVGAGPVGLALALDLGRRGHRIVVLNRLDFIAAASRAICFSKRSLDIFDRLGIGQTLVDKGVGWNVGKIFRGASREPVCQFHLLPVKDQRRPAFINLQQYYVEATLIDALARLPNVELRWGHRLIGVTPAGSGATAEVETHDGRYRIDADWLVACDGHHSTVRDLLALDFDGRLFEENFLIADIRMQSERPAERWFWFDPPFNPGRSALLHKQPDDMWRLDFQLGWGIDRAACVRPENVEPLIRGMLGEGVPFERVWYSVYTFQCRRMARFVHGRVLFAGDSAHLVSPFGARGCNGGIADIDNLGWKLDLVLGGRARPSLLESYNDEATVTADVNIAHSTRSTDFLTPKSVASQAFRDAVLELAATQPFARPFVNSGRLSTAVSYPASALSTVDQDEWPAHAPAPGSTALDAPLGPGWLLSRLGDRFVLLANGCRSAPVPGLAVLDVAASAVDFTLLRDRYDLTPGAAYLIRPDQYVAARWRSAAPENISAALARAQGEAA